LAKVYRFPVVSHPPSVLTKSNEENYPIPQKNLLTCKKTIVRLFQEKPTTRQILTETAFGEILIDFSLGVKLALQYRQDQRVVRWQIK
jgi:hypothetical protein